MSSVLGESEIRALIPHSGSMCLLDGVIGWDDHSIACTSNTHRDSDNPLKRDRQLSAVHAFEYAAQAVAVHGGLRARSAGATALPGYLASLRDAHLHVTRLDDIAGPLRINASRLLADGANSVYDCKVLAGELLLAEGRITIVLRTPIR
jgi:predicted hotdog family 3-hydroxylacyl-ACP dehydratase